MWTSQNRFYKPLYACLVPKGLFEHVLHIRHNILDIYHGLGLKQIINIHVLKLHGACIEPVHFTIFFPIK